ncbi:MAG: L-serine ammonia-lyase [Flavobacteriaceae bacterium]|nr:L-serine ammonia-lyase [Flavobacteriaceae bacterium]
MEMISVFDMLKIGVGPSSSHTLGPWRAAEQWVNTLESENKLSMVEHIEVHLYGSLSLTGKGHATDLAILLGLFGADPVSFPVANISKVIEEIKTTKRLHCKGQKMVSFDFEKDIHFHRDFLEFHPNGMVLKALFTDGSWEEEAYYSIGGGFVVQENEEPLHDTPTEGNKFPYPIIKGKDLEKHCADLDCDISDVVFKNELSLRTTQEIDRELQAIWHTMLECMYIGCHTEGTLPGGLNVRRRAFDSHQKLMANSAATYQNPESWLEAIRKTEVKFRQILKWVSCFALSVNEVNASLGRVVTAPTNGSAGVIPAVLMYYLVIENHQADFSHIKKFLLVAGEIGSIFKKGATISAAMGGCQAEIGVSSAMAAGALTELLGGTPEQALMAAEIAMEHHLGLTCDPINGLVQVPCIERNSMGAIKAINAAELALDSDPKNARIPLDTVVNTMWKTALDMNTKYKETSEGGLAVGVYLTDC